MDTQSLPRAYEPTVHDAMRTPQAKLQAIGPWQPTPRVLANCQCYRWWPPRPLDNAALQQDCLLTSLNMRRRE